MNTDTPTSPAPLALSQRIDQACDRFEAACKAGGSPCVEEFLTEVSATGLLDLLDRIVDGSNPQEPVLEWFAGDDLFSPLERRRGLPIGNLTSQWFANWYLDRFDHLVTSH